MADTPAQGAQAKMAMDAVLPFDTSSEPIEFITESLIKVQTHVQTGGVRGTRQRSADRVRINSERVTGSTVHNPTVVELDRLWPRILGGTTAGGITLLAETLPEFQVMIDRVSKVFTYNACRVNRATI